MRFWRSGWTTLASFTIVRRVASGLSLKGESSLVSHLIEIGETQSGKTYHANVLHRTFPGVSIFYNTNEVPYVWGERIVNPNQLKDGLTRNATKFVFQPAQDRDAGEVQLGNVRDYLFRHAPPGTPVWCQLVVDEAQRYPVVTEDLVRRSLGRGIRVVVVTQYPTGLPPGLRTNCPSRIVFKPGIEGQKFLRDYGYYPHEQITAWTEQKYHYVSYTPESGWKLHTPVKS